MRVMLAAAAVSVWAAGAWAQDEQPDGGALLDALARTQAYACTIGTEPAVILIRELSDGTLELVGAQSGQTAIREDGRIVILQGSDYLQIDGANSVGIFDGQLAQGTCTDLSQDFFEAVTSALNDENGQALSSMRSHLLDQLAAANAEADSLRAAASAEADSLRAQLRGISIQRDRLAQDVANAKRVLETRDQVLACVGSAKSALSAVLGLLNQAPWTDVAPGVREVRARNNEEKIRSAMDACALDLTAVTEVSSREPQGAASNSIDNLASSANPAGSSTGEVTETNLSMPMAQAERDAFLLAVQSCWVVDPGSPAGRVSVTVAFRLGHNGRVVGDVSLLTHSAESAEDAYGAFESARRAILRCQGDGFPLPPEKYEQWRMVEMTFDPTRMVIR